MAGIGVISNPRSRANRRDPTRMRELAYLLGSWGSAAITRSLDDLHRAAETFKAAGIDLLGINGGDGTISVTLTTFLEVYGETPLPPIALLRGGTMNTIARGLGIRGEPQRLLFDVADRYHTGEELRLVERPILRVGDRYGFIFGNGAIASFLEAYYATGRPSPLAGGALLARAVGSALVGGAFARRLFRRFRGKVTVDGVTWPREEFLVLAAATVPEIGLGFTPFSRCAERPGHFAMLGFHCAPAALVLELPAIYRGLAPRPDRCTSDVAREVTIETDEELAYTVDGDLYRARGPLRLATGPTLRLVVP